MCPLRKHLSYIQLIPECLVSRVDQPNLILRGNVNESADTLLKGSLVLVLKDKIKIHGIDMALTCESRIGCVIPC